MIAAIVLAAGESRRMGRPKALLPDGDGHVFVTRLLHAFHAAGVAKLTVVTGSSHAAIVDAVARDAPRGATVAFARNPDPSRGQLSSLWTGLAHSARPEVGAALVALVDVPFVTPATIRAVIDAHASTGASIVRPARGDRHGHPVLFARAMFPELRQADPARGAKAVLERHARDILDVHVDDDGALTDVDTPEAYRRTLGARRADAWESGAAHRRQSST